MHFFTQDRPPAQYLDSNMTSVIDLPHDDELIDLAYTRTLALLEASLADTSRGHLSQGSRVITSLTTLLADDQVLRM
jgi:hypothetical protein